MTVGVAVVMGGCFVTELNSSPKKVSLVASVLWDDHLQFDFDSSTLKEVGVLQTPDRLVLLAKPTKEALLLRRSHVTSNGVSVFKIPYEFFPNGRKFEFEFNGQVNAYSPQETKGQEKVSGTDPKRSRG